MKMISRKRFRKRIALFLLLVLLVPFVSILPAVHVSAAGGSPFPFDYPSTDTFYPVDFVIRLFNVDSAYYLRVRADTGQKIASWQGIADMYSISILPDPFSKYTYYDVSGNVVSDPFAGTGSENLELVRSESDDHLTDVFGVVIASNADLYTYAYAGRDALDTSEVYFYANYISLAVTPTPTPIAKPEIKGWYDYPELPSNFSADTLCILRAHNVGVNEGKLIGIGFSPSGSVFNYPIFYKDRSNWNYRSQALFDNGITINTWSSGSWNFSVFTVNYDEATDSYSVGNSLKSGWTNPADSWYVSSNLDWRGETLSCWSLFPDNPLIVTGEQAGEYSTGSWFEILFTNHNKTPNTSSNPNVSPTPTPNPSPTLMPQPTTTPTVEPPDEGDDNNWTGLFGWLKRIRDAILNIPKKIASGILNALKYIFIPDANKVKEVYNTVNNKFGIQHPSKFTFEGNEIYRPKNVIWKFHPISLNGEETEVVDITLIDFGMVDEWLDSSAGRIIIRIVQAMFGITMFAYAIYIFTKHIASINYTDARTLMHLDDSNSSSKGGWWIKDD